MARTSSSSSHPSHRTGSGSSNRGSNSSRQSSSGSAVSSVSQPLPPDTQNTTQSPTTTPNKKLTSTSTLPTLLSIPLMILHYIYRLLKSPFDILLSNSKKDEQQQYNNLIPSDDKTKDARNFLSINSNTSNEEEEEEEEEYLSITASPAITTLLDTTLYSTYEAELVPTIASATQLLNEFLILKETSAILLKECRYMVGVPFSGGINLYNYNTDTTTTDNNSKTKREEEKMLAIGASVYNGVFLGEGAFVNKNGEAHVKGTNIGTEQMQTNEISNWNEYETIQDFAKQCYLASNEAISKLTTDRLSESANLSLVDSLNGGLDGGESGVVGQNNDHGTFPSTSSSQQSPSPMGSASPATGTSLSSSSQSGSSFVTPTDAGIGRCYNSQPRHKDTWESPRLYCPDFHWADEAIGGCLRLLKTLSKHRFVTLVNTHGLLERYTTNINIKSSKDIPEEMGCVLTPPTEASNTPHVFPSLEAVHSLQYLISELLPNTIPNALNQFRAAVESNAVVSKRLYLVKCEYRAPMRALWESYMNLNSAPKIELVERYLRDYHGVKSGGGGDKGKSSGLDNTGSSGDGTSGGGSGKSSGGVRRKGSAETKKSPLQQQREKLEKQMTEKWSHPAFVEALQLERCCERMELEMSQMLLPLSNLASEIMNVWKGRIRAVAMVEGMVDDDFPVDTLEPLTSTFGWAEVPYMRELLRRLKSILRRKPDVDESTGIRPLLLDLQGIPLHKQGPIDSSIEMSFYPTSMNIGSNFFGRMTDKEYAEHSPEYFHLETFLFEVSKLLEQLRIPNMPFLVEERMTRSKGSKNTLLALLEQVEEVWDEDMFRAQFKDWFDMVRRQQKLNAGRVDATTDDQEVTTTTLSELSETIREAEIELSIAMASKDQLERVHKRLEALRADINARYKVLAQIVFDIGYRELNEGIIVAKPNKHCLEFPKLSGLPGVFGHQLIESGEVLPVC